MIEIDGAYGEGGGQVLRTSLTLAALTGKPVHIRHIRASRRQPGLQHQHLAAVKAIASLANADEKGASLNSTALTLVPSEIHAGRYQFDIATAGALTLVLQTILLPLNFTQGTSDVILTGGTHVRWSPIFHYLSEHWLPLLRHLGFRAQLELRSSGFFPKGGGKVHAKILPAGELHPFQCVKRGRLVGIRGLSGVANLSDEIAKRQKHQALRHLYDIFRNTKIKTLKLPSPVKGTFILLRAEFASCGSACYTALGAPGKPAEKVADEAVDAMLSFLRSNGCIDQYLADQLLLPLSLIQGWSHFRTNRITQHLLTNAHIIRRFLPAQIEVDGSLHEPGGVRIKGINRSNLTS